MIKSSLETNGNENLFIRRALEENIRLDGRHILEYREVEVLLNRRDSVSSAEICFGNTRAIATVRAEISSPFPDRPTEGILQFSTCISSSAQHNGISQTEISRMIERSIRESDAIDTESLCIIGGEKVWTLICDVQLVDYSGNAIDTCTFAAMAALRAFRKPETTVVRDGEFASIQEQIIVHSSDEREPLPLALHHSPLSITLAAFRGISPEQRSTVVLLADPSIEEERVMDGKIVFSINAHRELCAIHKPGGVGISAELIVTAANVALRRATELHAVLAQSLAQLEEKIVSERTHRLELLRSQREKALAARMVRSGAIEVSQVAGIGIGIGGGGIDRDDPILQWANLHQAVGVRDDM